MTLDSVTGLYYVRYRNYSPSLGTCINNINTSNFGGATTYMFDIDVTGTYEVTLGLGFADNTLANTFGVPEGPVVTPETVTTH